MTLTIVTEIMSDHSIYLRVSGIYIHEITQGLAPTYVGLGRFQHGPKCDICSRENHGTEGITAYIRCNIHNLTIYG